MIEIKRHRDRDGCREREREVKNIMRGITVEQEYQGTRWNLCDLF